MPKLIFNPVSGKFDYIATKSDLDLTGTNSGDVTVTDSSTVDFTLTGQSLTGSVIQGGITHNNLASLQGGIAGEYNHLTNAQVTALHAAVTVTDTASVDLTLTGQALSATVLPAGVDHGGLGGLLDDDHTQYALLAGRSGGQSLSGGTAANDDLTLQGTTNATRTTSYVLLQPNGGNVGIGTTSPEAKLQIFSSTVSDALMLSGSSLLNNARKFSGIIGKHYTNAEEPSGIIWYDSNVSSSEVNFGGGTSILNAPTDITFWAAANTTTTTGTEYLHIYGNGAKVIFPNGKVGIGTTSPEEKLSIGTGTNTNIDFAVGTATNNKLYFGTFNNNVGMSINRRPSDGNFANSSLPHAEIAFVTSSGDSNIRFFTSNTNNVLATEKMRIDKEGNVGINDTAPSAQLHVDQTSTTAAKPTLRLQQADLSEEFIRFDTTVGTGNAINTSALGTYYGRVRVYVEGVGEKWLALYNT